MRISKSMIKVLAKVAGGVDNLSELAVKTGLSRNRCSELAIELEKAHLLVRPRQGMKRELKLSDSPIAASFREMYLAMPYAKYPEFLYGAKLGLLQLLIYEPKSVDTLSKITHSSKESVRGGLRILRNANLLWREKSQYFFAGKAHPLIYNLLNALRTFTSENKRIVWKFDKEEIFRTREESMITELTGLNRFGDYGVEVNTIDFLCINPKRKISKNEVFVHGLLEINKEPRILGMAISFYFKNNINDKEISFLLEKYDLAGLFSEFKKTLIEFSKNRNSMIKNEILPNTTGKEIQRVLDIYGVKNV